MELFQRSMHDENKERTNQFIIGIKALSEAELAGDLEQLVERMASAYDFSRDPLRFRLNRKGGPMKKKRPRSLAADAILPSGFSDLLGDVKFRIQTAQTRAMTAVNSELICLYWDIGRMIGQRQQREGWGASLIPRLSAELKNELPELKGFSERNIGRMIAFFRAYPEPGQILPQAVAKLAPPAKVPQAVAKLQQSIPAVADSLLWQIPWGHHAVLLETVKDLDTRRWYMEQTIASG